MILLWYISTTFQMLNYDSFPSKVFVLFLFQTNHSHCAERETTLLNEFSADTDISKEVLQVN